MKRWLIAILLLVIAGPATVGAQPQNALSFQSIQVALSAQLRFNERHEISCRFWHLGQGFDNLAALDVRIDRLPHLHEHADELVVHIESHIVWIPLWLFECAG